MHLLSVAQFQVLGIGVEVRLEVGYGHAVGMLVVYAESAAHIDVLYLDVVSFQLVLQFIDSVAESLEAYHKIENITSEEPVETYDVVGPICESSDVFAKAIDLNKTHRGDLIALRSAGAYGEIMASQYNCRQLPKGYTTEEM